MSHGSSHEGIAEPNLTPLLDTIRTPDDLRRLKIEPITDLRPDLAIALLEKGLRAQPDKWEYMEDIGFVHYWYVHDYRAAGSWFQKASDVPGAPWWLRSLAATSMRRSC